MASTPGIFGISFPKLFSLGLAPKDFIRCLNFLNLLIRDCFIDAYVYRKQNLIEYTQSETLAVEDPLGGLFGNHL